MNPLIRQGFVAKKRALPGPNADPGRFRDRGARVSLLLIVVPSHARFFAGYFALLGFFAARAAHADTQAPPAEAAPELLYEAPSECPDRAQFLAAVAARGGNFERPNAGPELKFAVNVERRPDGFHASLSVQNGSATSNAREVSAPSCAEVLDALAVVTAIALNPPAASPSTTPPTPAPPPIATRPPAEPPPPPLRGATSFGWKKTVEIPAGKLRFNSDIEINARFGATLGFAPGRALPRLDLSFSRANFVSAPNGQSYLTGTVAQLRVSLLADTTWHFGDVRETVGGQEIGVGLCFSPHYDSTGWVLLGCGEISVGLMGMKKQQWVAPHKYYPVGNDSADAFSRSTQGFGALGLSLQASYNVAAHFQIGVLIAAQTLTRKITDTQPADGSAEVFHSSAILGTAVLGAGTHF
ncbi:MAG: hypothetical protein ABJB12_24075 [Pseudomonadota bacterium]